MKRITLGAGLEATVEGQRLSLIGDLASIHGGVLEQWLQSLPPMSVLDLSEFELEDGIATTHAVNAVRLMRSRVSALQIVAAPQVLAHNLYRTGLLVQGGIELKEMREDEPYG